MLANNSGFSERDKEDTETWLQNYTDDPDTKSWMKKKTVMSDGKGEEDFTQTIQKEDQDMKKGIYSSKYRSGTVQKAERKLLHSASSVEVNVWFSF